ncbi:hypothetical protein BRC68_06030 [Halobacteriales archaeon QH_6_64_20]|nr:MAG: hypothetical protein BRC68_06030 [Halobacteriales archaeon QH_6_64_20]
MVNPRVATDESRLLSSDRLIDLSGRIVRGIEVAAAYLLVGLFAVGVVDIFIEIVDLALPGGQGSITQPQSIIGLLDSVLLLFIIVELYQTVVAYSQEEEKLEVVTTALYAGVIAMVRKAILFQTSDYGSETQALTAAGSYMLILVGLGVVLFVAYRYGRED